MRIALLLAAAMPFCGGAQALDLVLDPYRAPQAVADLARQPQSLQRVRRVHVVVFTNGVDVLGLQGGPFVMPPAPVRDAVSAILKACREQGTQAYFMLELLRWSAAECPDTTTGAEGAWFERNQAGRCAGGLDGDGYASPWQPDAMAKLGSLIEALGRRAELPDGVTLVCRLSPRALLGFSDEARAAAVRSIGLDPIDVVGTSWMGPLCKLREDAVTGVLKSAIAALKAARPALGVCTLGTGTLYSMVPSLKARGADDWLAWLRDGLCQEVLLDAAWDSPMHRAAWAALRRQVEAISGQGGTRQADAARPLLPLVTIAGGSAERHLAAARDALVAQGCDLNQSAVYPADEASTDLVARRLRTGPPAGSAAAEDAGR